MNTQQVRNTVRAAALLAITFLPLRATVLTANFDALTSATTPPEYQEGGISFSNGGSVFVVAHAAYQYFWGTEQSAIVGRTISISTGAVMTALDIFTGNNWSDYLIASGQVHPFFAWETWLGADQTGGGTTNGTGKGVTYSISDQNGFDRISVSTWSPEFGQGKLAIGWLNVETLDSAKKQQSVPSVPDGGASAALLLFALLGLGRLKATSVCR